MADGLRRARVEEGGLRLDQFIARRFSDIGRRGARAALAEGRVFVDGKRCKVAGRMLSQGTSVLLHPQGRSEGVKEVEILHEDEAQLVVNKPAGLVVNATETSAQDSLVELFSAYDTRVVHRLDRETTGVVVLAKGRKSAAELSKAFSSRSALKTYWAVVEGEGFEGRIEAAIGRDRRRPRARAVLEEGKSAVTELRILGRGEGFSIVEAKPITGRTHQIRVHLAYAKSPIVGDALYGGPTAVRLVDEVVRVGRPLLHALELVLPSPEGVKSYRASVPADLARFARSVGLCSSS